MPEPRVRNLREREGVGDVLALLKKNEGKIVAIAVAFQVDDEEQTMYTLHSTAQYPFAMIGAIERLKMIMLENLIEAQGDAHDD